MMADWDNNDKNLLTWRAETAETGFEKTPAGDVNIPEQEYFDNAVLMVAMVKVKRRAPLSHTLLTCHLSS